MITILPHSQFALSGPQLCERQFAAWRETLWSEIKTDEMEDGAKNFVKEVKSLNKKVGGHLSTDLPPHTHVKTRAYELNPPTTFFPGPRRERVQGPGPVGQELPGVSAAGG